MADLTTLFDESRLYVDNLVSVTLTRPTSREAGAAASITVDNVLAEPRVQKKIDQPDGGSLDGTLAKFHLWYVECSTMPPMKDYRITHPDGSVWRVQEVEPLAHLRRFRCHCILHHGTATS